MLTCSFFKKICGKKDGGVELYGYMIDGAVDCQSVSFIGL